MGRSALLRVTPWALSPLTPKKQQSSSIRGPRDRLDICKVLGWPSSPSPSGPVFRFLKTFIQSHGEKSNKQSSPLVYVLNIFPKAESNAQIANGRNSYCANIDFNKCMA